MRMKIGIKRWGNTAGISLSKAMRKHIYADIGDRVDVQITNEGLLIRSSQAPKYTLKELLSSCSTESVRLDIEDIAWLKSHSIGREKK